MADIIFLIFCQNAFNFETCLICSLRAPQHFKKCTGKRLRTSFRNHFCLVNYTVTPDEFYKSCISTPWYMKIYTFIDCSRKKQHSVCLNWGVLPATVPRCWSVWAGGRLWLLVIQSLVCIVSCQSLPPAKTSSAPLEVTAEVIHIRPLPDMFFSWSTKLWSIFSARKKLSQNQCDSSQSYYISKQ